MHQTMMKKGWNRWSTQKTKVLARRTLLERWNGLAWVCTPLAMENGLAGVCMEWLWKGLARCGGEGSSGTTVFPQTQRVRLVFLCVGVTEPLPFLPSGQAMSARAHKQTTCAGSHPRSTPQKPMFRTRFVTCSRTHQGDGYRRPGEWMFSPKKSPKKPINRMCLGEESTDDPHTVRQQHHRPKTGC